MHEQLRMGIPVTRTNETVLRIKPYIQPFERYLAQAELSGLIGNGDIEDAFSREAEREVRLSDRNSLSALEERLAYWERIGDWELRPLRQVLLESERDRAELDVSSFRFHRTRRLRYGPHGIHEYRGKFFPQLVKSLINSSGLSQGSVVIDPMSGSGTTNCEARSMGMQTLGVDLNPLSVLVARVKTSLLDADRDVLRDEVAQAFQRLSVEDPDQDCGAEMPYCHREVSYLQRWFARAALDDIRVVRRSVAACHDSLTRGFMEVCLSNIITSVSWQKQTDLRVRKEVRPYVPGTAAHLFQKETSNSLKKVLAYLSWFDSSARYPEFDIVEGDSRRVDLLMRDYVGKCDSLLTSPPYAMALPYIDTDRLSLAVLGLRPRSRQRALELQMIGNREVTERQRQELWEEYLQRRGELPSVVNETIERLSVSNHREGVGFRRRNLPALLGKYFLDMADGMSSARTMMRPGAFGFYVVGNNSTRVNGERVTIETDRFLWEIGRLVGWKQRKIVNMELVPSRDIFRNQRGTAESILWFEA